MALENPMMKLLLHPAVSDARDGVLMSVVRAASARLMAVAI